MSSLEKRVLRIIELKEKEMEDEQIAGELNLDIKTINLYIESTQKAINYSLLRGYDFEKIAEKAGLSLTSLNLFASHYKIKLPKLKMEKTGRHNKPQVQRIAEIKQAVDDGLTTPETIGDLIGSKKETILQYCYRYKIKLPKSKSKKITRHNKPKEERIAEIKQAVEDGLTTPEEFMERVGLKISTIYDYAVKNKITLPFSSKDLWDYQKAKKKDQKRDMLIREGLPLEEIGDNEGSTKETIRQYILKSGQDELYKEARKNFKKTRKEKEKLRKQELCNIAGFINSVINKKSKQLPKNENLAFEKARRYQNLKNSTYYPFESLFGLFKEFFSAKESGKKVSLEELGIEFGLWPSSTGRIIKAVGERALYGSLERKVTSVKKKQALKRAVKIKMSSKDLAYLMGLNEWVVTEYFKKNSKRKNQRTKPLFIFGRGRRLTYRLSSEIYHSLDLGFSREETMELLEIPEEIFDYAKKHKKAIKNKIMKTLQILYPGKKIKKPYPGN